jgi:hypothetical protein
LAHFLSDFLFDLLKRFKEKLFDLTALVKDHLGKGSHISELFVLNSEVFTSVDDLFTLLFDDCLVLVPDHFFLPLEIIHDLVQTFGKYLDLAFVGFMLLPDLLLTHFVLVFSACIDVQVAFEILV